MIELVVKTCARPQPPELSESLTVIAREISSPVFGEAGATLTASTDGGAAPQALTERGVSRS
jgi:hypothetical protein